MGQAPTQQRQYECVRASRGRESTWQYSSHGLLLRHEGPPGGAASQAFAQARTLASASVCVGGPKLKRDLFIEGFLYCSKDEDHFQMFSRMMMSSQQERSQAQEKSLCWSEWQVGDFGCCQPEKAEDTSGISRMSAPEGLRVRTVRHGADLGLGRSTTTWCGIDSSSAMQYAAAPKYQKAAEENFAMISRFESRDNGAAKLQRSSSQAYLRQGQDSISLEARKSRTSALPEAGRSRTSASPEAGRRNAAGAPPAGTRTAVSPHRHHLHHSDRSDHKSRGLVPAWEPAPKQITVVQHAARPRIQRYAER